jgi:hypothetical protein
MMINGESASRHGNQGRTQCKGLYNINQINFDFKSYIKLYLCEFINILQLYICVSSSNNVCMVQKYMVPYYVNILILWNYEFCV